MRTAEILYYQLDGCADQIRDAAREAGCELDRAGDVAELLSRIRSGRGPIVLAPYPAAESDYAEILDMARRSAEPVLVIFQMTAETGASEIVRLVKLGAYDCLAAGCDAKEMARVFAAAREDVRLRTSVSHPEEGSWRGLLVGESSSMQDLARIIHLVAPRRSTVLITGETGTGKEVAARAIHMASDRSHLRMVALNCSAIPENLLEAELFGHTKGAFTGAVGARIGRFEEANNSTLFLDEIGDMPIDLQSKLLRVLQEREVQRLGSSESVKVNVRVIAASNLNLLDCVKQGTFREDLYYRLNVVPIIVPPLRHRASDIPLLAYHFVNKVCRLEDIPRREIYTDTLRHLMRYSWPGNVRQLENMVEKAVVMSGDRNVLEPGDFLLPTETERMEMHTTSVAGFSVPDHGIDFAQTITAFERHILDEALRKTNGNKTLAADLLRLKRTTLVSKLRVLESTTN